jgi:response regulator RpfG family c-di-GMP phosphodiesterase
MSTNPKQVKIYRKRQISKKPILVVDDEFDIVNIIELWLNKQNIDVCGYTDPLLALEHFKDNYNKIDLVLSDIRMPQMNGYEFANRIKALQPKVKVILMSSFEIREVEFSKLFHSVKIDSLISKPISMKNLTKKIQNVFNISD